MQNNLKSLSIILPCHNEEEVIKQSWHELKRILDSLINQSISDYEIVMVNNGSSDNTLNEMLKIQELDKKVIIVDLRNNFGYQGSITAGLYNACKDMVITIDADLQDDPEKIPEMIEKHYEGFDLVLGVRPNRTSDSFLKRGTANLYYKFLNFLGVSSIPHHGDFRLMSKELVEDFKLYTERNRYIRGMILNLENKYATVEYVRRNRQAGETKFKPLKLIEFALDGITSFSAMPIRFITIIGFLLFFISLLSIAFIVYQKVIAEVAIEGWAFIALSISLFGGLNSLFIGIVGEYVGKNYIESKERPNFVVRKIYKKDLDSVC